MTFSSLSRLTQWRPGRVARNTAHASLWNVIRIAIQASSLIFMARTLGAEGYGALAGAMALFMVCGQFTGLGSGVALVRDVVRGGDLASRLMATERAYLASGLFFLLLALPLSQLVLGPLIASSILVLFAVAELVLAPLLQPLVYRYQAEERLFLSSATGTLAPITRLLAIATAALLGWHDLQGFALLYVTWLSLTVAITLFLAWPRCTSTRLPSDGIRQTLHSGLPYAVSGFALTAGSELDKTVLLRLAGEAVTGPYAAAYRVASAATLPVSALILATVPRLFQTAAPGTSRLSTLMLAVVVSYASLAAGALWLLAPLVPWLLGQGFASSVPLLQVLCLIVLTGSLRQYISALLTTRDLQASRNLIEAGGVIISLLALFILIPLFGAYGAVFAVITGDVMVTSAGAIRLGTTRTHEAM